MEAWIWIPIMGFIILIIIIGLVIYFSLRSSKEQNNNGPTPSPPLPPVTPTNLQINIDLESVGFTATWQVPAGTVAQYAWEITSSTSIAPISTGSTTIPSVTFVTPTTPGTYTFTVTGGTSPLIQTFTVPSGSPRISGVTFQTSVVNGTFNLLATITPAGTVPSGSNIYSIITNGFQIIKPQQTFFQPLQNFTFPSGFLVSGTTYNFVAWISSNGTPGQPFSQNWTYTS